MSYVPLTPRTPRQVPKPEWAETAWAFLQSWLSAAGMGDRPGLPGDALHLHLTIPFIQKITLAKSKRQPK